MAPAKKPAEAPQNNERNEYIPSFIAKKPFYIDDATASQDDYLEHQRLQSEKNNDPLATSKWYDRGIQGPAATKYRKGACENCGAMTHKAKDCLERKRKHGARWTGKNIAADEKIQDVKLGWDAKRDRWNGYDAAQYEEVVQDFQRKEATDDARYEEETDMGRQQSTATRNLRLREDTAKYLLNLDVDSAKYDPKTRTIEDSTTDDMIAEEGFEKASGDAAEFEAAQRYAWETQERGDTDKLHLQANPTAGELSRKRKAEEDVQQKEAKRKALLEQYGSQDEVKKSIVAQSNERYIEYDDRGRIKGEADLKEKSMYPEDVLINNHTSVWGSWWKDFAWGYACCHSTVKNSFCTGKEGIKAIEEAEAFAKGDILESEHQKQLRLEEEDRIEERRLVKPSKDESLRKLEDLSQDVTEAQMEEYRRNRTAKNDPMAAILGKDVLLGEAG